MGLMQLRSSTPGASTAPDRRKSDPITRRKISGYPNGPESFCPSRIALKISQDFNLMNNVVEEQQSRKNSDLRPKKCYPRAVQGALSLGEFHMSKIGRAHV